MCWMLIISIFYPFTMPGDIIPLFITGFPTPDGHRKKFCGCRFWPIMVFGVANLCRCRISPWDWPVWCPDALKSDLHRLVVFASVLTENPHNWSPKPRAVALAGGLFRVLSERGTSICFNVSYFLFCAFINALNDLPVNHVGRSIIHKSWKVIILKQ